MGQVIRDDSNILGVCLSPFQYVCEKFDVNCATLLEHICRDILLVTDSLNSVVAESLGNIFGMGSRRTGRQRAIEAREQAAPNSNAYSRYVKAL